MSQAWTDADRQALLAKWEELRRYRDFVNKYPYGLPDPDKAGHDAEQRAVTENRMWIVQIGSIVNLEKDYVSSPRLGPSGTRIWDSLTSVRADMSRIAQAERDVEHAIEDEQYGRERAKGSAAKGKHAREIRRLQKALSDQKEAYARLREIQRDIVEWHLGLAVAKDAGIMPFSKRMTRFEEHDRKFKHAADYPGIPFEVRDEHNKVVARARSSVAAHRTTRHARFAGSRVA